jgi:integrase
MPKIYAGINKFKTGGRHNGKPYAINTQVLYLVNLRTFITWAAEKGDIPAPLEEILKIRIPKANKMTFSAGDILTEEEVKAVLDCCPTTRDRAFVAMLYDGGLRTKELCTLAWKDLDFINDDIVTAQTVVKTGVFRKVPLFMCREYLIAWRNAYPGDPSGNNAVFVNRYREPFVYSTAHELMKRIGKRVKDLKGIDMGSRLKLHQFRRASITHDVNKNRPISHICMEKWGRSYSPMIERYAKPGEAEILNSKIEASGVEKIKRKYEKKRGAMQPIQCPKCGMVNPPTNRHCGTCGRGLTEDAVATETDLLGMLSDIARTDPQKLIEALKNYSTEKGK